VGVASGTGTAPDVTAPFQHRQVAIHRLDHDGFVEVFVNMVTKFGGGHRSPRARERAQ
jgi:hypothetical protein